MKNKKILVIGGGPAGLMAADVAIRNGLKITVIDSMPTLGRKFLMAGKSGLNLTMNEDTLRFKDRIIQDNKLISKALDEFGPNEVIKWVNSLGIETFTGSTGRVFPKSMKASPLLRKWINQLVDLGVLLKTRWKLIGISDTTATFQTPEGIVNETAYGIILALGGASWPKLGSTGDWQ